MPSSYQILFDGQPADPDFYTSITSLEIEENMDLPGAMQLNLPVNTSDSGDLTYVTDARFQPLAVLAVVATPGAGVYRTAVFAEGTRNLWLQSGDAWAGWCRSFRPRRPRRQW